MTHSRLPARKQLVVVAPVAAVVVVAIALSSGPDNRTKLTVDLQNASGLREGSAVKVGGADVGKVTTLDVVDNQVRAELRLDPDKVRLGKGMQASISALNLLGSKYVDLQPGNPSEPLPPNQTIPAGKVAVSTDLDQVLDVLDADTRTRLAVAINELGTTVDGNGDALRASLKELPPSLVAGTNLLSAVSRDNTSLADAITTSDRFIGSLTAQRKELTRLVDTAGETMETVSARREALGRTLDKAPGTMATLQSFLGDLQRTTVPLGPAARSITAAAKPLRDTLAQVEPFNDAASPTLKEATRAAPALTRLARGATPVVRRTAPVVENLANALETSAGGVKVLNDNIDDASGVLEGWARATSSRDGLGHIFRGRLTGTNDTVRSLLGAMGATSVGSGRVPDGPEPGTKSRARATEKREPTPSKTPTAPSSPATPAPSATGILGSLAPLLGNTLDPFQPLDKTLEGTLNSLLGRP